MPKDFTAPSQNWNVQDQFNQSKQINQENNNTLDLYKKKTQALATLDKNLSNLEANGYDTTEDRKYFERKSKEFELSFGEKLGVVGRNLGNDYASSFSKAFGGNLEKSYSDKLDEAKQKREEVINPISTIATEVALDPLTYTPLSFASKGTKAVRMAKDFGKGAGLSAGLYTAKEYGDDNYNATDSAIAGAFGGGLNALLGRVLNRKVAGDLANSDVTSGENITNKILFEQKKLNPDVVAAPTQPIGDEVVQENIIKPNNNSDDIASKINKANFGDINTIQPDIQVRSDMPKVDDSINSEKANEFFNPIDKNRVQAQGNGKLPTPTSQQDPFVYNPNKPVDTFGFEKDAQRNNEIQQLKEKIAPLNDTLKTNETNSLMGVKRENPNDINLPPMGEPRSILPDTLPTDRQEMLDVMKFAKDNNAVDEFISKLPPNAQVDKVKQVFDKMPISQPKEDNLLPPMKQTEPRQTASGIAYSNGSQTFGGASVGGLESEYNQRDYNNDGKHDYKDNVYGAIIGALGVKATRKLFPKAFKDGNIDKNTNGMFVGKSPTDTIRVENQGKYKIPLSQEVQDLSKIKTNELNFKEFNNPNAKHQEQKITNSAELKRVIDKALGKPIVFSDGTSQNTRLISSNINGKDNIVVADKQSGNVVSSFATSKPTYISKVIEKDSGVPPTTHSSHQGTTVSSKDAHNTVPSLIDKSISNNITKSQDIKLNGLLERVRLKTESDIATGKIPERRRTVISPYENGKEYFLGESGSVYFKRANGKWMETPNVDTINDVNFVAKNGLSEFKKMNNEADLRFEKALEESKRMEDSRSNTYKMDHRAPNKDNGAGAYDLTDMFSKDIYSKDAARLFGHGATKMDNESISLINKVRNKPEAEVTIYRAVPKDLDVKINPDDWVTTSKEYAKVHGESALKGNYKILEMKVKEKDLYTDGNSIHEWGWSPHTSPNGMTAMSSPTLSGGLVGGVVGGTNDLDGDGKTTYKDIAIGALGGAGLTKGALLAKNTNIADKAKSIIKNIADTETADKIFGHKIYQKTDYMNLREAMIVGKNKQMESFALLHEQLKLLDDTTRTKMYNYMSGDKTIQLDTNIKQLADNYTGEINKMGKELVDLGVLEQAQFDKFKDRYLHRRYEKDLSQKFNSLFTKGKTIQGVHARGNERTGTKTEYEKLLANGDIGDFFQGKIEATRMNNGQYKFRQDWTDEQRARWGEIKDIAFSLPETLMRTREMIDHAKMLKNIVDNTGYVSNDALEGYVQLSGKRYGALNGKYVPSDIASDIKEFGDALFGAEGKLLSSKGMEAFKALSTFWKKSHTVYNPIAHLNNLLSNVTMQFGAGVNPNKAVVNATKGAMASQKVNQFRELTAKKIIGLTAEENAALRALSQDEDLKLWNQAQQSGLFGRSNLNDILNKYINPNNAQVSSNKFKNAFQKVDEVTSNWYQGEDNIMRFSMLKSLTESGISFDDAIKQINNTIPDYTKPMSQWARFGRDSMLTPFISWTYYATPIILKQMKDKPERIAAIYGALYGMNQLMGIDPFNEKDIPQQNFSMKRIPIYKNGNEVTTIKVDRWIPHNDILNPLDFIKNLTSGGAWTPIGDIPRNRNSYFGGKITHNEGALKAYDLTKYGIQQITPDALDNVYNFIESKVMSEKKRTKNPVIKPRTTTEELLKNVGLNVMTYNKANQARKVANEKMK